MLLGGVQTRRTYEETYGGVSSIISTSPQHEADNALQNLNYEHTADGFLFREHNNRQNTREDYQYDKFRRLVTTTLNQNGFRLSQESAKYDINGNIKKKNGLTYYYGDAAGGGGPNAVSKVRRSAQGNHPGVERLYAYDGKGNLISGPDFAATYNAFNKPVALETENIKSTVLYDANHSRVRKANPEVVTTSIGGMYDHVQDMRLGVGETEHRYLIKADGRMVATVKLKRNMGPVAWPFSRTEHAVLVNRLGSIHLVADENGAPSETFNYDAWGKRRELNGLAAAGPIIAESPYGFTGHEHDDEHGLINMKGRMYDPALGRFMSVDPVIQAPTSTQSFNGYSYLMNNPLGGTDPSGYVGVTGPTSNIQGTFATFVANAQTALAQARAMVPAWRNRILARQVVLQSADATHTIVPETNGSGVTTFHRIAKTQAEMDTEIRKRVPGFQNAPENFKEELRATYTQSGSEHNSHHMDARVSFAGANDALATIATFITAEVAFGLAGRALHWAGKGIKNARDARKALPSVEAGTPVRGPAQEALRRGANAPYRRVKAGKGRIVPDQALSEAGRGVQKHGVRVGDALGVYKGLGGARATSAGATAIDEILQHGTAIFRNHPRLGKIIDVVLPAGNGARWTQEGFSFIGFL